MASTISHLDPVDPNGDDERQTTKLVQPSLKDVVVTDLTEKIEWEEDQSSNRKIKRKIYTRFLNVGNLSFILGFSCCCIAISRLQSQRTNYREYYGSSQPSPNMDRKFDCSQIQTMTEGRWFTNYWLGSDYSSLQEPLSVYDDDDTPAPPMKRSFMIDIKSPANLSFIEVKVIDVIWNLLAAQGLRLLMGYTMYHLLSHILVVFMHRVGVSYNLFMAAGLEGVSLLSLYKTTKEVFFQPRRRNIESWFLLIWTILSMIYTLSVPSLLNATAGYMSGTEFAWKLPDGTVTLDILDSIKGCFKITDGHRINLPDNSYVSGPPWGEVEIVKDFLTALYFVPSNDSSYELFDSLVNYHSGTVNNGTTLASTTTYRFKGQETILPAPPLDLGFPYPQDREKEVYGPRLLFCHANKEIPDSWSTELVCVSDANDNYSWGIVKTLTINILIAQAVWCFTAWLIWLRVSYISRKLGKDEMGPYQKVLLLTGAMRVELRDEVDRLPEKKLEKNLGQSNGISGEGWGDEGRSGV